jgi:hypothetical protein
MSPSSPSATAHTEPMLPRGAVVEAAHLAPRFGARRLTAVELDGAGSVAVELSGARSTAGKSLQVVGRSLRAHACRGKGAWACARRPRTRHQAAPHTPPGAGPHVPPREQRE